MVVLDRGVRGAPGVWSRRMGESLNGSIQHTFIEYCHVIGIAGIMEDTGGWQIASYMRDSSCGNQCFKGRALLSGVTESFEMR